MSLASYGKTPLEQAEDNELRRGVFEQLCQQQRETSGWAAYHARAKAVDHQQRIAADQAKRDSLREGARRVASVGVEATLTELIRYATVLRKTVGMSDIEKANATAAILRRAQQLLAYELQYHPRPVEIRSCPRQSW